MFHRYATFALLFLVMPSCASIATGSEDAVEIKSDPAGAHFTTNTGHAGTTPSEITIPDSVDLVVDYTMPGYEPQRAEASSQMSAWFFGNIIIGGLLGMGIDLITGNYQTHPSEVSVILVPVGGAPARPAARSVLPVPVRRPHAPCTT